MSSSILLLDNDSAFQSQVMPELQERGFTVHSALNCTEAQLLLKQLSFDLIAVSATLPDGDGLSWLVGLRSSGESAPVIFTHSNWLDAKEIHRLLDDLAVSVVVHKPI